MSGRFFRFASTLIALSFAGVLAVAAGCGDDNVANGSIACSFDVDCPLGQVCSLGTKTCTHAACNFCSDDQVCYVGDDLPDEFEDGSCSAPECTADADCVDKGGNCANGLCSDAECAVDADCGADQVCNLAGQCEAYDGSCAADTDCKDGSYCGADGTCAAGCRDSTECAAGETCDANHECAGGSCTAGSCAAGEVCDSQTGACRAPNSCGEVTCPAGEACDPTTFACAPGCTPDAGQPNSCGNSEICNTTTGQCQADNCFGEDPAQCATNVQRPLWDPVKCFCAECTGDADCDAGAGETCNANGSCFACTQTCDAATPGVCTGGTPYCINDCCLQCVGAADCVAGEICLDGFCGQPPSCAVDPNVCPAGYTCMNGQCQPPQTGGTCDPSDPTGCPMGTFCDPATGTCGGLGGGLGCGFCNMDCTCDNGLTCDGLFCSGCDPTDILGGGGCKAGELCFPGLNVCLPLG